MTGQAAPLSHHRQDEFEIDLKSILHLVTSSYKLILIVISIFLACGIYYAQTRIPLYQSVAMIEVGGGDTARSFGSDIGSVGNIITASLGSSVQMSSADVEAILLRSPYLLGDVICQLRLDISVSPHYSGFFEKHFSIFRKKNSGNAVVSFLEVPNSLLARPLLLLVKDNNQYVIFSKQGTKILDGVVGQLESGHYLAELIHIQVNKINAKPGAIFDVVKWPIPDVSDSIAGALSIKQAGSSDGGSSTGIMRLSYISKNREQAQQLLNIILSVAVKKNIQDKSEEASQTLNFISKQLPIAENHLQQVETTLDEYSIQSGIFDPKSEAQFLSNKMDMLQQTLEETDFKKMTLLQKFTPIHPLVIAITDKENLLKRHIAKVKTQLQQLPRKSEKEILLQRDAKIQDSIYAGLMESAQHAEMIKAATMSNVKILSAASYPISRIPINKRMIIFSSIAMGLIFSLAIIFIRHVLSPIIDDPDVVERTLGVAVAAIIPCSKLQSSYNKKIKNNKLLSSTKPFLLALENPGDISIEAMRSLRTSIQLSFLGVKNNIISITGCRPGIGKSFVSSNLAALLSDLGKHALLIDADLRLGKINQSLGKQKAPGLSTYLQKEASISQIIQTVIPGKLDFIASGLYPQKPAELLHSSLLDDLIRDVSIQYDLVVIDTPPILAVTDPVLILRHSAINLMVLGVGKDHLKEVLHTKSILEKGGVSLTGIVFNTLTQPKAGFGRHYGYSNYRYTYGT